MHISPRTALAAVIASAIGLAALPAAAIPVLGGSQIDFVGSVHPRGGTDVYNATGLDFRTNGLNSFNIPGSLNLTATAGGSFVGFNPFTCPSAAAGGCGTIRDLLAFGPLPNQLTSPVLPVINFLTFTQGSVSALFDLTSFNYTQVLPSGSNLGSIQINGFGTLHFAGYDDTAAIVTLSSQGPSNTSFAGSLIATGAAVPEPASMLLLGAGLVGLGTLGRIGKRNAA